MKRRTLLAATALASLPSAALLAQQTTAKRVGVLMLGTPDDEVPKARLRAFRQGLNALGWTEGRNVRLDVRWASNQAADVERLAAELAALRPDVILANGTP